MLRIPSGEVHLWWVSLEVAEPLQASLAAGLSSAERGRAARFVFAPDRRRFVVARASLRMILGRYLERRPEEVDLREERFGKPRLGPLDVPPALQFNLSHAHELALIGLTADRRIGVDVEWTRPLPDLAGLAATAFSPTERRRLLALEPAQRLAAFYRCWTRKEAYLKARGDGLQMPLDVFDVSLGPEEPAALLAHRLDPAETRRWWLASVVPADGYVGAVAVEGGEARLHLRGWHHDGLPA